MPVSRHPPCPSGDLASAGLAVDSHTQGPTPRGPGPVASVTKLPVSKVHPRVMGVGTVLLFTAV